MKLPKGYTDELIATDGGALSGSIVDKLLRYGSFDDAFLLGIANKVFNDAKKPRVGRQEIIGSALDSPPLWPTMPGLPRTWHPRLTERGH
ncbi:hypothetical protein [Nonomuraea sp. B19D2]|uniref:hypothetical protein n=1 Tax=Nonomuraea sp. B19D2 TaxID=3159561 RepID=UPI0032DA6B80